ncbi:MAG: hypothetical protein CMB87_00125 [Flammeovirgaceae bacterium]|nr:hypothetical protein [Flammeovirgaceae bacterium]|tara:strand:+ start:1464 stop:2624 length:1161 start_codon:yes stop_codon:yes gene_type:complete
MENKFYVLIFSFMFFFSFTIKGDDNIEFSIITIGPYEDELYSAFGHSGIRYRDKLNNIDLFYNYGIFDFDQPNFYLNFLNGRLLYMVGKYNYQTVENFYINQKRYVKEQVLNLNNSEKIILFNYLEQNIRPENRTYLYNYVYNNCATKIRDILITVYGERITFKKKSDNKTIRALMDKYLKNNKWGDLGIDICLGLEIDKKASYSEEMFLPEYLFNNLEDSFLDDNVNLISKTNIINSNSPVINKNIFQPKYIFLLFLIICVFLSFRQIKYSLLYIYFDFTVFFISGVIGVLLIYLWFFTDHLSSFNYNLIWAFPFNLIFSFLLIFNFKSNLTRWYTIINSAVLFSLLILWNFLPQNLNDILMFFVLGMLLRVFSNYIYLIRSSSR